MSRSSALCLSMLAMLAPVACAPAPTLTPAISGVAIGARTDEAAVLQFSLDVGAGGEEPLSLKEVRYTLSLDGHVVFAGARYAEATATANNTQVIRLPAPVRADQVDWPLEGLRRYRIRGSVAYLRPGPFGALLYDLGVKRRRVRFSESGALQFDDSGVTPAPAPDQAADSDSPSEAASDAAA